MTLTIEFNLAEILSMSGQYAEGIRRNESWYDGMWATPLPELRFF